MAKLKVPSVIHLARNWRPSEVGVKDALIALANSSPPFSYSPLLGMLRSMITVKSDLAEMELLINRGVRFELARKSYLEIAPLLSSHFSALSTTFVQEVSARAYPLSRHLRVPFEPPMIFGAGGKVHLPIFIFWRKNPLKGDQLALLASLVRELIAQDPDLDLASTTILDFSIPKGAEERSLREIPFCDIPELSVSRRDEMLAIFAAGYELARHELEGRLGDSGNQKSPPSEADNDDQHDLFADR
jgi:hypothetical protein